MTELSDLEDVIEPRHRLWRGWLPVVIWLAVIFYASTKAFTPDHTSAIIEPVIRFFLPKADPSEVGKLNLFVRKSGHVVEYAILALLLAWATLSVRRTRRWWFFISLGLIVLVAASDEFHQLFVPGREGSPRDVLIDTTAGYAALGIVVLFRGRFREPKELP
jgi:VanZ family protein